MPCLSNRLNASTSLAAIALRAAAAVGAAGLVWAVPATAQDYTSGALAGTVTDAAGQPVAGATVTVRSAEQGFERTTTSGDNGGFRLSALPPGQYRITIASPAGDLTQEGIAVAASATASFAFVVGQAETSDVVVTAARQRLDFSSTTTGVNVDLQQLVKQVPLGRNLTEAILLAPTATRGDDTFGNLPAIGGSSVAENAYYINGLNITNFDKYLGSAPVPFEFFRSVEVKTGGYPAEFGRATGGIINAVSKSGTNDWTSTVHLNWEPDALYANSPDTYRQRNRKDTRSQFSTIVEAGGAIIKDRLFVYGLTELRDVRNGNTSIVDGVRDKDRNNDPIFAAKIDAYPIDDHHLELTFFDTKSTLRRRSFAYDDATDTVGAQVNDTDYRTGGISWVGRYTGNLARWLTVSGAYGISKDRFEVLPSNNTNRVVDNRAGDERIISTQTIANITDPYRTKREFFRLDADLYFNLVGDHHVRFGMDRERNTLRRVSVLTGEDAIDGNGLAAAPGGVFYTVNACGDDTAQCIGGGLAAGDPYVAVSYVSAGGTFKAQNTAYYAQDEWKPFRQLTLNLGVRYDNFVQYTVDRQRWSDLDAWAPRVGFALDPFDDGRTKVFGNYGRYFLPIASNTSFSNFGAPISFSEYYRTEGTFGAGKIPTRTGQITAFDGAAQCPFALFGNGGRNCNVIASGIVPTTTAIASSNLKPSEEDEFIFGVTHRLGERWTVGATYTRRRLLRNAEDTSIDAGVRGYCAAQGIAGCADIWGGFHQYVIVNPGRDVQVTLNTPLPGETTPRTVTLLAADLALPKPKRKYDAVELTVDRAFDGVWSLRGSYTWSDSRGNTEGFVQSDYGQDGAGIVIDFDQPDLTEGAYGKLPNHRAHQFKLWGGYQVSKGFSVGLNASLTSPRLFSCIGNSRGGFDGTNLGYFYGAYARYCLGGLQPRGTGFDGNRLKSDWIKNLDVSLRYTIESPVGPLTLRADVFNLLNLDGVTDRDEFGEVDFNSDALRNQYGLPLGYQQPRYVRLGFDIAF